MPGDQSAVDQQSEPSCELFGLLRAGVSCHFLVRVEQHLFVSDRCLPRGIVFVTASNTRSDQHTTSKGLMTKQCIPRIEDPEQVLFDLLPVGLAGVIDAKIDPSVDFFAKAIDHGAGKVLLAFEVVVKRRFCNTRMLQDSVERYGMNPVAVKEIESRSNESLMCWHNYLHRTKCLPH